MRYGYNHEKFSINEIGFIMLVMLKLVISGNYYKVPYKKGRLLKCLLRKGGGHIVNRTMANDVQLTI